MEEYISFETADKCGTKLSIKYSAYCHKQTKKVWRYPENSEGGHPQSPSLEDRTDMWGEIDEIWSAFNWNELYELMNVIVDGDYRKSKFECIENIDDFALQLYEYIKEKFNRNLSYGIYTA